MVRPHHLRIGGDGATDRFDELHVGIEETFAQDALADHSGCAEDQDTPGAIILFFRWCVKE
jgi:hypothetical protein